MSTWWITENKDVLFANNFAFDDRPSAKSFTPVHEKTCPFKVTIYFLSFKKANKALSSLPKMAFCFSLKIIPFCQILSNAFEISRKTCQQYSSANIHLILITHQLIFILLIIIMKIL